MNKGDSFVAEEFADVLNSNDVDALKTALQNLMVLFEQQNRNYLELKEQLTAFKLVRPPLAIEQGDNVTIGAEEAKPLQTSGLLESAYEMLAAMRLARKTQEKSMSEIRATLKDVIKYENSSRSRLSRILEKRE